MTALDTARLRKVAEAATPGGIFHVDADDASAAFVAAASPPTVLALLDRLDAAEAALGKVRAVRDRWQDLIGLRDDLDAALASTQREER